MKVVINTCFGGFAISALAVKRLADLQGKPAFFFLAGGPNGYTPVEAFEIDQNNMGWSAFTIPNPDATLGTRADAKNRWGEVYLTERPGNRSDPLLVKVVEELGEKANGSCAKLKVVEIPDGMHWEISDYDGKEHIAEVHQTWS